MIERIFLANRDKTVLIEKGKKERYVFDRDGDRELICRPGIYVCRFS